MSRWVPGQWKALAQKTRWVTPKERHPRLTFMGHINTHLHSHTHTRTHNMLTHALKLIYTYSCTHTHTKSHIHTLAYARAHTHTHTQNIHTYACAHIPQKLFIDFWSLDRMFEQWSPAITVALNYKLTGYCRQLGTYNLEANICICHDWTLLVYEV